MIKNDEFDIVIVYNSVRIPSNSKNLAERFGLIAGFVKRKCSEIFINPELVEKRLFWKIFQEFGQDGRLDRFNVQEEYDSLLIAADYLHCPALQRHCEGRKILTQNNLISTMDFASFYRLNYLGKRCIKMFGDSPQIVYGLDHDQFIVLIRACFDFTPEKFWLSIQENLFWLAMARHQKQPSEHLDAILREIRLYRMPPEFVKINVATFSSVKECPEFRYIHDRIDRITPVIFAFQGPTIPGDPISLSKYYYSQKRWLPANRILVDGPVSRKNCSVFAARKHLFMIGGQLNSSRECATVHRMDTRTMIWEEMAPLHIARRSCAVGTLDGNLCVGGGIGRGKVLDSIEIFSSGLNMWHRLASPMLTPRSDFQLVQIDSYGLYAVDGRDAQGNIVTDIERFDSETEIWEKLPPMNHQHESRSKMFATSWDNKLFVLSIDCKYQEMFDPLTNSWTCLPQYDIPSECGAHTILAYRDCIHLLTNIATIQYDIASETWVTFEEVSIPNSTVQTVVFHH